METRNEIKRLLMQAAREYFEESDAERSSFWEGELIGTLEMVSLLGIAYFPTYLEQVQRYGLKGCSQETVEKAIELSFKDLV